METIVYFDEGYDYKGRCILLSGNKEKLDKEAKDSGHIGYMIGRTIIPYHAEFNVIVYFYEKPSRAEMSKRIKNGFLSPKWHYL